jgi:hypothetical protein
MAIYRKGVDKEGNTIIFVKSLDDKGKPVWTKTEHTEIPKTPISQRRAEHHSDRRMRAEEIYQRIIDGRDPYARQRIEIARNMPFGEKLAVVAGRESDKLLAGAGDIKDWINYSTSITDNQRKEAIQSTLDRRDEQKELDRLYREFEENQGAAVFGAMPVYMTTGLGLGPAARSTTSGIIKGATKAKDATKGFLGRNILKGVDKATKQPGWFGQMARRFKKESIDPRVLKAQGNANHLPDIDPWRQGIGKNIASDTLIGGIEGGLHYDMDVLDGMLASGTGSATGSMFRPFVSNAPNFHSKANQDLIQWGESKGMRFLPGAKTGSNAQQMFEAGIRNDTDWTDAVKRFDRNNDIIMNRQAYKAMGIADDQIDEITPAQLKKHRGQLRDQYNALENETIGKLDYKTLTGFKAKADRLAKSSSKFEADTGREMQAQLKKFSDMYYPQTKNLNRRGRQVRQQYSMFDGKQFQDMHTDLKTKMDSAYKKGNYTMYYGLKEMNDELNNGLKRGLKDKGGDALVKKWQDLNEHWAVTDTVIEKGMNPDLSLNLDKLSAHFMSDDATRMLTETGTENFNDLYKMAKLRFLERRLKGSPLTGHNMHGFTNPERSTMWEAMLKTPAARIVPMVPDIYMELYKRGWPASTGLLNMNNTLGKHLWELPHLTRASAQASQIHPALYHGAVDGINFGIDAGKKGYESLMDLKTWMFGDEETPNYVEDYIEGVLAE